MLWMTMKHDETITEGEIKCCIVVSAKQDLLSIDVLAILSS